MSKMTLGLMSLFALVALLGTSVISAEAAQPVQSDPIIETTTLQLGPACGSDTATHSEVTYTTIVTTWEGKDKIKFQTTNSDPVVDAAGNVIGELKSNYTQSGHTNDKGVYKIKFTSSIHCEKGGVEQRITFHTITHN